MGWGRGGFQPCTNFGFLFALSAFPFNMEHFFGWDGFQGLFGKVILWKVRSLWVEWRGCDVGAGILGASGGRFGGFIWGGAPCR